MASGPWDNVSLPSPPNGPAYLQAWSQLANTGSNLVNNAFNAYQKGQEFQYQQNQRNFFQDPNNQQLLQQTLQQALPGQQTYADFLAALIKPQGTSGASSILPLLTQQQAVNNADKVANPAPSEASGPNNVVPRRQDDPGNYYRNGPNDGEGITVNYLAAQSHTNLDRFLAANPQYRSWLNKDNLNDNEAKAISTRMRQFREGDGSGAGAPDRNPVAQSGPGEQEASSNQLNPSSVQGGQQISPAPTSGSGKIPGRVAQAAPVVGGYAPPSEAEIRRYEASGNRNIAASRMPGLTKEQAEAYRNRGDQDRETAKQLRSEREKWQSTPTNPAFNEAAVERKAKEDEAAADAKMIAEIGEAGLTARGHVAQLETINKLGQKVGYGVIPKVQSFLGQHGIETRGLSDIQAYERAIDYMAPQLRPIGSGRLMAQELNAFKASLGGLMTTPEGRQISVENLQLVAKYQDTIGAIARDKTLSIAQRIKKIDDVPAPHLKTLDDIAPAGKGAPPMQGARQAPDGFWYVPDPNRQGKYLRVQQ